MSLKNLPLGIQSFKTIREDDYLYIDKTEYLCNIATKGKFYFLSRPRRFGKSLSLTTLKEMFLDRKDLFAGLYAENNWKWGTTYPVIHIQFNGMSYDEIGLERSIDQVLRKIGVDYGLTLESEGIGFKFEELIVKLHKKYNKVVVLIDEYDKPIVDYLTKDVIHKAYENRNILRGFYGILKAADEYLKFVFITGISKFAGTGIFSQLNNLTDLSAHYDYSSMLGYTEKELKENFTPYLANRIVRLKMSEEQAWKEIKRWYNGYTWNEGDYVYNPYSILRFFDAGTFENFWFKTGTPTFLINLLKEKQLSRFERVTVLDAGLDSYDLENLSPTVLMYQTGYLTIVERNDFGEYTLDFPNYEVKNSFYQFLLAGYMEEVPDRAFPTILNLRRAFIANDSTQITDCINAMFASIPNTILKGTYEAHYHAILHIAFQLLGLNIQTEVNHSSGRPDIVVHQPNDIWIIEFKLDKSAEEALSQIENNDYAAPYRTTGKIIHALGINFSSETKRMDGWREVTIEN